MNLDLGRALDDIVGSASTVTGGVPVARVMTRRHRRRVARQAGTAVAGVTTAGAVAFGGLQWTARTPEPVATQSPTATQTPEPVALAAVTTDGPFVCGQAVPTVVDPPGDAELSVQARPGAAPFAVTVGQPLEIAADLVNGTTSDLSLLDGGEVAYVAQGGLVVGTLGVHTSGEGGPESTLQSGGAAAQVYAPELEPCDATGSADDSAGLAPGAYEIYLTVDVGARSTAAEVADLLVVSPAYALTVEPAAEPDPQTTDAPVARPALDALVIRPDGLGPLTLGLPHDSNPGAAMIAYDPDYCTTLGAIEDFPGRWRAHPDYRGVHAEGYPQDAFSVSGWEASGQVVDAIEVHLAGPRTAEGIGVGSTRDDLFAAYPDLEGPGTTSTVWWLDGTEGTIAFEFPSDDADPAVRDRVGVIRVLAPGTDPQFRTLETGGIGSCG